MTIKRREFTTYAAAGFVAAGAAYAGVVRSSGTLTPTSAATTSPTSAPAPAPTTTTTATASAASAAAAPTAAAAASGLGYPFGARLAAYVAGTKPSQTTSAMDALLTKQYDAWKAARVVDASSVIGGGYAIKFSNPAMMTVSEGMGYGLLIAVLFAGHDPNARQLFDGLLAVARTRYAYGNAQYDPLGKYLMDWELYADGTSAGGGWNAVDGDLDMAMALLMADKQWGSASGKWNYLQEGKNTIAAIKSICMKPDGTTKGLRTPDVSRTSDYMIGHFRAFAAATGDTFWNTAVDRAYQLSDMMQSQYSAGVGLMPDFIVATNTTSPYPSPGYMGDGNANEDKYWWNACRNPWRFSSDYLLSGDARWKTVTQRIVDFFHKQAAAGDVTVIGTGYTLAGAMVTGGNSPAYHGPICAGACIDAQYQSFVDALWNWNASHLTTGYYDGELQLLSMVVASGNWWSPLGKTGTVSNAPAPSPAPAPAPAPAAAAVAGNIVANSDFSSGMASWVNWGNSNVSNGMLQVGSAAGGVGQDLGAKIVAGTQYTVTAIAGVTNTSEGVYIGVKLFDAAGNVLASPAQAATALSPASLTFTFTAPAGVASAQVFVWKNANSAVGLVRSIAIAPVATAAAAGSSSAAAAPNLLVNGDFSGGMNGWGDWGNTAIVSGALQVKANTAGGCGQDIVTKLVAGKTYLLTATANITTAAEGVFVGVKLTDASGAALVNQAQLVTSTSPKSVSIKFTAPAGIASGNVFVWKNANGAAGVVDNVSLVAVG